MRTILLIGAGRSATSLIQYLLEQSNSQQLQLRIGDLSEAAAARHCAGHPNATPIALDIFDNTQRRTEIIRADLVISLLPAHLHLNVAQDCLALGKNLVTASYVSAEMAALDAEVRSKGLVFMNEVGLDPGIDHMSAMHIIDTLRNEGADLRHFESYCGGLIAPECDSNAWKYKFTWAPRNVIVAGQGGVAKCKQLGQYKYIPYSQLFKRTDVLDLGTWGQYEAYANRDSLKYEALYGLDQIDTLYRGTIRKTGYCAAWDQLITLGLTDDSYTLPHTDQWRPIDFLDAFLPAQHGLSTMQKLQKFFGFGSNDPALAYWHDSGLLRDDYFFTLTEATPAQLLEAVLSKQWVLAPDDRDLIVMYHRFGFPRQGQWFERTSTMVCQGDDAIHTGMSKTVGLPAAMAALLILNGQWREPGVQIPVHPQVYQPILAQLAQRGIVFTETERAISHWN